MNSGPRIQIFMPAFFCIFFLGVSILDAGETGKRPAVGKNGMIATAHPLATRAGLEILKKGGNAVDAAVAAAFVLGVVEPYASGIGGGGFMLVYGSGKADKPGNKRKVTAIDYRETAPSKTPVSYKAGAGRAGPDSIAVPGTVAGLARALSDYGTMRLKEVMEPAIKLAEDGYPAGGLLIDMIERNQEKISGNPEARKLYLEPGYTAGGIVRLRDLARTYRMIAEKGPDVFYRGVLAEAIAGEVNRLGGSLSIEDLSSYKAVIREPVRGDYKGYEINSMPPPSSGGVHVIELLNILERFDMAALGRNSVQSIQIMSEAMRRVFRDRVRFMGDPDFIGIPVKGLTSRAYAGELARSIAKNGINRDIAMPDPLDFESCQTTHVSTADRHGNLVALTQTINSFFGSGVVVPGTGIILNNEMSDFGGWEANKPAPGKKPVSNMSPTVVLKGGKPCMSIGTAGAARIISVLPQIIINVVDFGMNIQEAINAPKFHCMSDEISMESRISRKKSDELSAMGYAINRRKAYDVYFGGAQGLVLDPSTGTFYGGADPRRNGSAEGY